MFLHPQKHTYHLFKSCFSLFFYKVIKMSESQSRYSIVERLTSKKLDIISSKTKLAEEVEDAKHKIEKLRSELKNWEMNIKQDNERTKREKEIQINEAETDAEDIIKRKSAIESSLNEQIKTIDESLDKIQKISETAPTNQ